MNYEEMSKTLKALADPKRLKIIDLLSCGSLCACDRDLAPLSANRKLCRSIYGFNDAIVFRYGRLHL